MSYSKSHPEKFVMLQIQVRKTTAEIWKKCAKDSKMNLGNYINYLVTQEMRYRQAIEEIDHLFEEFEYRIQIKEDEKYG